VENHIAVDIGASSGRLVWGRVVDGRLALTEIHRFANGFAERDGHCYWNIDYLFEQVLIGLQKAKKLGISACTLGIDTWAVDYVLLDRDGKRLHEVYAYRDERTQDAVERVTRQLSARTIYEKTGIQFQKFNTLFQLAVHDPAQLRQADKILLVPDYLTFLLTGKLVNEVTNASTTQLLNLHTKDFDEDLLRLLSLSRSQFAELVQPGTVLGEISKEWRANYNLPDCQVIVVATHDTASAVLGVPADQEEPFAYLSSGTWSLIGVEKTHPICDERAQRSNFANEWGAYHTYRFLKNIMGLWLIQEVQRSYLQQYSFAAFVEMAKREKAFRHYVDFTDDRFLHPPDMVKEIQVYCEESDQEVPATPGEVARCIFDNLAILYTLAVKELEAITGQSIAVIHIVGGGANNELLCQLTADISGKKVIAGPTESTAMGNLLAQMIASHRLKDVQEGRKLIRQSFASKTYLPSDPGGQESRLEEFAQVTTRGTGGSGAHGSKADSQLSGGEGTVRESRN